MRDAERERLSLMAIGGLVILTMLAFLAFGCQRDLVTLRPGSPVVVTEASGTVRVSAWDEASGSLVDLGWADAKCLIGLTATDYDWTHEGGTR